MIDLDGTDNKENSVQTDEVALAAAKAAATEKGVELYEHIAELNGTAGVYSLPVPMMNIPTVVARG